jgi:hypothetical protein
MLAGLFFVGCGGNAVQTELSKYSKENIQKATIIYTVYLSLNNYKGPANMEEMKEFVTTNDMAKDRLEGMSIDVSKFDDYMVGRDGEVFEFRWSLASTPLAPAYPICFEVAGVDGVRQCGVSGGKVHEFSTDEEYEDLKKGNYIPDEAYKPTAE